MSRLAAALADLARRLEAHGAPYMVIGGYANLQWGRARVTEDPDVEAAIRRAVEIPIEGVPVRFATAEDLILHKIVSERPRDREDIEAIARRQAGRLDLSYLRPRIAELAAGSQQPNLLAEFERQVRDAT